jgi:hypothetical protein
MAIIMRQIPIMSVVIWWGSNLPLEPLTRGQRSAMLALTIVWVAISSGIR